MSQLIEVKKKGIDMSKIEKLKAIALILDQVDLDANDQVVIIDRKHIDKLTGK